MTLNSFSAPAPGTNPFPEPIMKHPQNRALLEAFVSCVGAQGRECGLPDGRGVEVGEYADGSGSITIHFGVPSKSSVDSAPVAKPAPETIIPSIHNGLPPSPSPSIGSIVHYQWASEGEPFAAVVTRVMPTPGAMGADLCIFRRDATEFRFAVPYSLFPKLGCWSWPKN